MFDFDQWQAENESYLSSSLDWVRSRLQELAKVDQSPSRLREGRALAPGEGDVNLKPQSHTLDNTYQPALEVLASRFQLSDFEKQVLLLCAGMELDTRVATLCAMAQGDSSKPYPTASLCFSLFDDGAWDILSPERSLRRFQLIEIDRHPQVPLTSSPIRIDDRVASYIKGLNFVDEGLGRIVNRIDHPYDIALSDTQRASVDRIIMAFERANESGNRLPVIQFLGPNELDKRALSLALSSELGIQLYELESDLIPKSLDELDIFVRRWQRESKLMPMGLVVQLGDGCDKTPESTVARMLGRISGVVIVECRDQIELSCTDSLAIDVNKPTAAEQTSAWTDQLPESVSDVVEQIVGQFDLALPIIREVAEALESPAEYLTESIEEELWGLCRERTRPKLEQLAQRVDAKATWDDIVLDDEATALLRQVAAQVRHRGRVLDQWGFRDKHNRGIGVTALFAGESGTGKTMAAEVIANDLGLDLYRIDLSSVLSKWVGESEKALRRIFDATEDGGAILFFDEADSLFSRRSSEVKDSHDRYANVQVNYLLQRMESYRGLAILATNHKQSMDSAFTRRLRFIIDFRFPEIEQRKQIWRTVFPASTPLSGLDYQHLAKLRLTGGNIHNIALNAAYAAAANRPAIDMPTILAATKSELAKSQKPINASDLTWQGTEGVMG